MNFLKNRYILVLSILFVLIAAVSIFAYTSKNYNGNFFSNQNIKKSPEPLKAKQNPQNQNTNPNGTQATPPKEKEIPEYKVKGIYITGWTAGRESALNHIINLVNNTELNTVVIDVKDDEGRVTYKSQVPLAIEIGSSVNMVRDMSTVMNKLKDNKIHTIARIVVFKDPILTAKRPDLAIKTINGQIWRDRTKAGWLNPYNKDSWNYSIDLAKEAAQLGFDEIQFDYVRFPTDGKVKLINYGKISEGVQKTTAINNFLAQSKKELAPLGVPVSADVFGIITTNKGDVEKIGQDLETVSKDIDYISPMVYPSHYGVGQYGISKPDLEPYKIVYKSLSTAKARLDKLPSNKAKIRPYLQDFTATWLGKGYYKKYSAQDIRAQIKATYDSGLEEWILWSAVNKYSEAALLPEK